MRMRNKIANKKPAGFEFHSIDRLFPALGSSPGMCRVYACAAEDDAVYTTGFGIYDAPAKAAPTGEDAVAHDPDESASTRAVDMPEETVSEGGAS